MKKPDISLQEWILARLHALQIELKKLSSNSKEEASIKRISKTFLGREELSAFPSIVETAKAMENARGDEIVKLTETLIHALQERIHPAETAILLVEYNRSTAHKIADRLATPARDIYAAYTAEQARKFLSERTIHLVLLDLVLPDSDGRAFLSEIKEQSPTAAIPVIVISPQGAQSKVECIALGAESYFEKPLDLDELATFVASTLQRSLLHSQKELKDSLTGLPNRAWFCEAYIKWRSYADRHKEALSIGLLDLDHFKAVNDNYGHAMGDKVLCQFAKIVAESLRESDILARWGGEEFAVLFPGVGLKNAVLSLDRARKAFQQKKFTGEEGTFQVTFSGGIIEVQKEASAQQALAKADKWLYLAKANGRNSIASVLRSLSFPKQKALLAEDTKQTALMVQRLLEAIRLEVVYCENGAEALQAAQKEAFDLVVLDILMPKLNGLTVLQSLRRMPIYRGVPIVMLTALGEEEDISKAFEYGADDYIVKPLSPLSFTARIRRLLRKRKR